MHIASADRPGTYCNLDVIISVGYRVNSKRGTQFRIWATRVLKDHLVKGYTANERRLAELRKSLKLVRKVMDNVDVTTDGAKALLGVVTDCTHALDLLDDYDHQRLSPPEGEENPAAGISCEEACRAVESLRTKLGGSDVFGQERDDSLHGSLAAVMQTFGGRDLYPSLESKAAHLLHFLRKNHSLVDGNKRIADNALVALTIMIAASDAAEKDIIVNMTINHIIRKN